MSVTELRPEHITIAVTVYSRRDFVLDAIRSALNQTVPVRIIVVEDCGPDPGIRDLIAGEFGARIEYFRNPKNRGLCDNWNACMEYCGTPWISILHDDDLLHPWFVETMLALVRDAPKRDLYFGRHATIDERGKIIPAPPVSWEKNWRDLDPVKLADENFLMFAGQLFSVSEALAAGGVRATSCFTGDWDLWMRLAARGGAAQTAKEVSVVRSHYGEDRGTSRVERLGWKWALDNVQRKRNLVLLRQEKGIRIPFERAKLLNQSPIPSRILLRHAHGFSQRLLAYNAWLFVHSSPPHFRYAVLQWIVRLFGPGALRALSVILNRARPATSGAGSTVPSRIVEMNGSRANETGLPRPARSARGQSQFVVATPARSVCDNHARALEHIGRLRFLALGTRRGTAGVPPERTRLNPWIGLTAYIAARTLPNFPAESFRFRLHPWFDRWVERQLHPGDHIISSAGFANACFKWVQEHGGTTFLDGGNSHPQNFWDILTEEHRRWKSPYPPVTRHLYERNLAMMEHVDYVLSPSEFVSQSFLAHGFQPRQILKSIYPVDLSLFQPPATPKRPDRPLTVICTGALCLRKGTPYLLEAFRLVRHRHPSARLLLTRTLREDVQPILAKYRDLPIEWAPPLAHALLAERLRSADVFVLPSLEEGLVRTACEAMACGLQVVLTPNTGANDFVEPGVNGEIVPIRDAIATAEAILKCWERVKDGPLPDVTDLRRKLSYETFEKDFIAQLTALGFC